MNFKRVISLAIGIAIAVVCLSILSHKFNHLEIHNIVNNIRSLTVKQWFLAALFSLGAYASLATYDSLALKHLGKKISWLFITLCSFTSYALSHNIGASVFSGAFIRYRAYKTKGLSGTEIAILVAFCSFTFALGVLFLSGLILAFKPEIFHAYVPDISPVILQVVGTIILLLIILYAWGGLVNRQAFNFSSKLKLIYPNFHIIIKQLLLGPAELIFAAAIIYSVLPTDSHPSFILVLGIFIASFSATLISNAPAGGLGVLEVVFLTGLPEVPEEDIIAALLVFRVCYLLIPLIISLFIVAAFELKNFITRKRLAAKSEE